MGESRKWYEVRAGDVVRGHDGHNYTVIRRYGPSFTLARPGVPPVTASPSLDADVYVVRASDTTVERLAAQVFINAGFTVELLDQVAQLQPELQGE
jgi:hypothetical protein